MLVTREETAAIVAAVQEKMDDVVPDESEEEEGDPADQEGSNPPAAPIQHSIVRLLPSVEMMVENEIWQYRYPPFDNIFTPQPEEHQQQTEKAKLHQTDFLPSYVIGVLDPSELVDGLFLSSAAVQHQRTPTTILNSPEDHQDETISNFRLRDSVASSSNSKSDKSPRSFLIFDNDRWIWPGNNKKSSS